MLRLAVLQVTHDKIIDAKIGMELAKFVWSQEPELRAVDLYHAYNGAIKWYPKKYLESQLIRRKNLGHFEGAADLIDAGMDAILSSGKTYDYILVMSGDVWLVKPDMLAYVLTTMKRKNYSFAATLWFSFWLTPTHFASEFFIISPALAEKAFPLALRTFYSKRPAINILHRLARPLVTVSKVELALTKKILWGLGVRFFTFGWRKHVYILPGRKLVYRAANRYYSEKLGYLSHHDLPLKRSIALKNPTVAKQLKRCITLQHAAHI